MHKAIWELFGDHADRRRDFLYRIDSDGPRTVGYILSARPPAEAAAWKIETKPFEPRLASGDPLVFRLRANPTVNRRDPTDKKARRHDVVMDTKRTRATSPGTNGGRTTQQDLVQAAGYEWLARRCEPSGISIEPEGVVCDSYTQHQFRKGKGKTPIRLSSIDYAGHLTVEDPATFLSALVEGFGAAKGFGMGLMLIRRP